MKGQPLSVPSFMKLISWYMHLFLMNYRHTPHCPPQRLSGVRVLMELILPRWSQLHMQSWCIGDISFFSHLQVMSLLGRSVHMVKDLAWAYHPQGSHGYICIAPSKTAPLIKSPEACGVSTMMTWLFTNGWHQQPHCWGMHHTAPPQTESQAFIVS